MYDRLSIVMLGTGVVALAGVVVGHNIVLVDTFYQLRRSGFGAAEAAMRASAQRFRPVILTTAVTVVGLLPLMFQIHPNFRTGHLEFKAPGSEWWVQLSGAVVWGLSFSTLLTLVLTPVLLAAPQVVEERLGRLLGRKRGTGDRPAHDLPRAAE
jgi:multidrug efflux pump